MVMCKSTGSGDLRKIVVVNEMSGKIFVGASIGNDNSDLRLYSGITFYTI